MPNAGDFWEQLLYGLAGTSSGPPAERRDRILAALRSIGYRPGDPALDPAALAALAPHRLVIVAGDGADDDVTLVAIPDAELDDGARDALARLDGASIDVGTADDDPALFRAWQQVALATGARDVGWFEDIGAAVPDDARDLIDRWSAHAFRPDRAGRLDGARLDRNFAGVTFVIERV